MTDQRINIKEAQFCINELKKTGQYDVLLDMLGVSTLQQLNIVAARAKLSRLEITADYHFLLTDYKKEVEMSPLHKALYIFFLNHEDGVEFKHLQEYREELMELYKKVGNRINEQTIEQTIDRLVNPLDNSINEKTARIKSAFAACMDEYRLTYYAISSHSQRKISGSDRIWYDRRRTILLSRDLVTFSDRVLAPPAKPKLGQDSASVPEEKPMTASPEGAVKENDNADKDMTIFEKLFFRRKRG